MHYLQASEYTHLSGEINSLYHEAAVKMGISDSVMNILYVICENGTQCQQSEISRMTGISRQTINSAIRKLQQDDIVTVRQGQGRNTIVSLVESGQAFAAGRIHRLFEIENRIWNEWTPEEQQQYLRLTQMYRDGLRRYMDLLPSLASQEEQQDEPRE